MLGWLTNPLTRWYTLLAAPSICICLKHPAPTPPAHPHPTLLCARRSVPPYMIVNRCRDVVIRLRQVERAAGEAREQAGGKARVRAARAKPGSTSPWDGWDEVAPTGGGGAAWLHVHLLMARSRWLGCEVALVLA
jgi:hypothetical protein